MSYKEMLDQSGKIRSVYLPASTPVPPPDPPPATVLETAVFAFQATNQNFIHSSVFPLVDASTIAGSNIPAPTAGITKTDNLSAFANFTETPNNDVNHGSEILLATAGTYEFRFDAYLCGSDGSAFGEYVSVGLAFGSASEQEVLNSTTVSLGYSLQDQDAGHAIPYDQFAHLSGSHIIQCSANTYVALVMPPQMLVGAGAGINTSVNSMAMGGSLVKLSIRQLS